MSNPRWTYSTYRAALRLDGKTVAIVSPDHVNAFTAEQARPLIDALNSNPEATERFAQAIKPA